jgi:hypothetical protein
MQLNLEAPNKVFVFFYGKLEKSTHTILKDNEHCNYASFNSLTYQSLKEILEHQLINFFTCEPPSCTIFKYPSVNKSNCSFKEGEGIT